MLKSISLTITATFIGQALGFLVDILIANGFGTSWKADAYFLALMIPVILSDLFMAAINAVFIPAYISAGKRGGEEDGFFSNITNTAMLIIASSAAAALFLTPYVIGVVAGGFSVEARSLTVALTRILLILVITMPLSTLLSSRLNAHGSFALPALGKSFNFGCIIIALIVLKGTLDVFSLPAGFIAGNIFFVLSLLALFYGRGLGYSFKKPDLKDPALMEVGILLMPLFAAGLVNYINIFVERGVAARFPEGSIASLSYAFKLVNIPVNLFVLGSMSVILPAFSRLAVDDRDSLGAIMLKGLRVVSFFILPLVAFMTVFREPLVRLFFERGEFSVQSTGTTSLAVFYYLFGIPSLAALHVMTRIFYAMKDLRALSLIGVLIIALNIVLMLSLSRVFGFMGIPLTFALSTSVNALAMVLVLKRRLKMPSLGPFILELFRHLAASFVLWFLLSLLVSFADLNPPGKVRVFAYLSFCAVMSAVIYAGVSYLLRAGELKGLVDAALSFYQRLRMRA